MRIFGEIFEKWNRLSRTFGEKDKNEGPAREEGCVIGDVHKFWIFLGQNLLREEKPNKYVDKLVKNRLKRFDIIYGCLLLSSFSIQGSFFLFKENSSQTRRRVFVNQTTSKSFC